MNDINLEYLILTSAAEGIDNVSTFGVCARLYENGRLAEEEALNDIFCCAEETESFLLLLREEQVFPCHLVDVAEDWLSAADHAKIPVR